MQTDKKEKNKTKTLVLLDTHGLIHRAFHALPPLTSPTGSPVGAVYGVANILLKIIKEFSPDYIAAALDRPEPTFRHEVYKEYKAQRAEAPPDLIAQFETVRELFRAFGIRTYDHPGYEADDIIGTLVAQARKADSALNILIASGDMDMLQLVDDERVAVFTMRKGIADTVLYDEDAVQKRFGFSPWQLPDFKGLKGDPSDNIKGVPGVGEKTATALIQAFGQLEKLYEALATEDFDKTLLKGKLPATLRQHKDVAFFSRDLARIRMDAPIAFSFADTAWEGVRDTPSAQKFLEKQGFVSLRSRLPVALSKKEAPVLQKSMFGADEGGEKREGKALAPEFFTQAHTSGIVSWMPAPEDGGESILVAVDGIVWRAEKKYFLRLKNEWTRLFNEQIRHISFDGKEVLKNLWRWDIVNARMDFDIGIASWVCDPTLREPEFAEIAGGKSVGCMPQLAAALRRELKQRKSEKIFAEIEMPLLPILAGMEYRGIMLDAKVLERASKKLERTLAEREERIHKLAGTPFNINSPKQLAEVLFEKLGIAHDMVRKTGGGAASTRVSELLKLRGAHPIVDELIQWREESKLKSTYVDVLPQLTDAATGRIHTTFMQTGTATGRLSSQNPNMQNIPVRTPLGQEIRRAFVAEPGYTLVSCDYSQIELRLAASLSGDELMIKAFRAGKDIHALTAAAVNNVPPEEVTASQRRAAKTINFGILYGMGAVSLSESLGITRREADSFIRAYFAEFPRVKMYLEGLKRQAEENGYVETLFGRRRYFPNMAHMGWQARREAERMAINAPIQGSGADIIKMAMIRVQEELAQDMRRDDVRLLLQVHDELLFEVRENKLSTIPARIRDTMENVSKLAVLLRVDMKTGKNWQDMA